MKHTSEFVTLGHPDKVADYITSYVLDRYVEADPFTRYAVEVQVKDNFVTLGGEVTSKAAFSHDDIRRFVREAVKEIGYTHEYAQFWGAENALDADNLDVSIHIGTQSPDIAQGVDADGWGDQGIFWGMATTDFMAGCMPRDYDIALAIGKNLFEAAHEMKIGLDIKTQVETNDAGNVNGLIVAAPVHREDAAEKIEEIRKMAVAVAGGVAEFTPDAPVIVNGTGAYVKHSSWGDCGTTGRKLAVDFYGGGCKVGGGSPWTKDGTKADLALNIYARKLALDKMREIGETVYCAISSCIGRREISIQYLNGRNEDLGSRVEDRRAEEIIREFDLRCPVFCHLCRNGLFSKVS